MVETLVRGGDADDYYERGVDLTERYVNSRAAIRAEDSQFDIEHTYGLGTERFVHVGKQTVPELGRMAIRRQNPRFIR